ncbi:MAG: outer membrane protein assembly factor BamD [Steroidobacteraceae bacterium]
MSITRKPLLAALCLSLAVLTMTGCSSFRSKPITNADQLYDKAKKDLDNGDYAIAIKNFELLEARFPFSNVTRQSQLDLMYAYYENGDKENVIDQADQFIRENPTHPRVDYAYYMKGLANFDRDRNFLERWFRVDLSKRPPVDSRTSFQAFQVLIQRFPNSQYAPDARQRMVFLRNRLASYEVYVARYYMKRGAYVAALNRSKYTIENYDGAPAIKEALEISRDAYAKLGLKDLSDKSEAVLKQNFPG